MRPIKFRGKRVNNGEFIYGQLTHVHPKFYVGGREVKPESVAQLVGYDCDGREVYEGDVLTFEHDGKHYEYTAGLQPFARNDDGLVHYKFDSLQLKEEKKP